MSQNGSAVPSRRAGAFRLFWLWLAIWLLMLVIGMQESLWSGGRRLWQPIVDYGTAALAATVLAAFQSLRARRCNHLLSRPWLWFRYMWAWMPLQLLAYVMLMYGLRMLLYGLGNVTLQQRPWAEVLAYEASKFLLFYGLFGGIHFGVRSYRAWVEERLRAEQQANLARQAQLLQLTQQLQPHFLFNALNTISALIHSDPDTADLLLTRLATLLRAATDAAQKSGQRLDDELALLRAYADIMTQRFAGRVQINWALDPDADACRVPTLGLQPLLENCFRHVVERRREPTRIAIQVQKQQGSLQIVIEDDGPTFTLPGQHGVGLRNLQARLQSLYGGQAGLTLHVRDGGGLRAQVSLPCVC